MKMKYVLIFFLNIVKIIVNFDSPLNFDSPNYKQYKKNTKADSYVLITLPPSKTQLLKFYFKLQKSNVVGTIMIRLTHMMDFDVVASV